MATVINEGLIRVATVISNDISHAAVGTNNSAEANNDSNLGTETDRLAPTSSKVQGNQLINRTFFSNSNLPATVEELGWFMNGSGSVDSGEFLVRALSGFVKGSQDLNIVLQITINRG